MDANPVGPSDESAVQALLRELDRNQSDLQESVVQSLVEAGAPAVSGLIKRLEPITELAVRRRSALILGGMGPGATDAIAALIDAVVDKDRGLQNAAIKALKQIDPNWLTSGEVQRAIPMLVEKLNKRLPAEVHTIVKRVLSHIGAPAVPDLIQALSNSDDGQHQSLAAETLGQIGPDATSAVTPLTQALSSDYIHVRQYAAEALGRIGKAAEPALVKLLQALEDRDAPVRGAAVKALAQIDTAFDLAAPAAMPLLADKSDTVRKDVIEALAAIGPTSVPLMIELLEAPHIHQLLQGRLKELKQNFEKYQLCQQSREESSGQSLSDYDVMAIDWHRRERINELTPELAVAARLAAVQVLIKLGPLAQAAVPILLEILTDQSHDVRQAAAQALAQISPESTAAMPSLMNALLDRRESVQRAAEEALNALDPEWRSTPMANDFMQSVADGIKPSDLTPGAVLTRIGQVAVPKLIGLLRAESRTVRESATERLGQMGHVAESAIDALKEVAQDDSNGLVRRAAECALDQIRKR